MPWYYPRRRWRRRRWYWRRRTRPLIRRRIRRKYRVRKNFKRKLKKLPLMQWQPPSIKKCKITGLMPLVLVNKNRIGNNSVMYEQSIVPQDNPGGGGFSVVKLSLEALYSMHLQCQNWWTVSNDNMPLCRFIGMDVYLYQCEYTDFVFRYINTWPATSVKLTYPSCQPGMLMLMKHSVIIPSRQHRRKKKPYTKIHINPPAQLVNKWYFQQDLNATPLVVFHTAACSLDQYYIKRDAKSNNCTIKHLNTKMITNRNFYTVPSTGWYYKTTGTQTFYFYKTHQEVQLTTTTLKYEDVVPLTQTTKYYDGESSQSSHEPYTTYKQNPQKWAGNPFTHHNLLRDDHWFISEYHPKKFFEDFNTQTATFNMTEKKAVWLTEDIILETRYNPLKDTGVHNSFFLLSNYEQKQDWEPPTDETKILQHLPLWLGLYGFVDYNKKVPTYQKIDTNYMLAFRTDITIPKYNETFIPLGKSFLNGLSPYSLPRHPDDSNKWHPQVQYQQEAVNDILLTGPGAPKLDTESEEIKIRYKCYFKWGGNPAPMITIDNPAHQATYPIPRNNNATTSLQNPTYPPEYYLYSFDERDYQITKAAQARIKKDYTIKETLLGLAGPSAKEVPAQAETTETSEESDSEKEEETLLLKLHRQRLKQRELKHRLKQLMDQLQNTQ
nr:MAG: ORF1 [TTV-like mini virus]